MQIFIKIKIVVGLLIKTIFEEKIEEFLKNIIKKKNDYLKKRKFKKIKLPKYLE